MLIYYINNGYYSNIENYSKEELEEILDDVSKYYYDNKKDKKGKDVLELNDNEFDFIKEYLIVHYQILNINNIGTDCVEERLNCRYGWVL